MNTKHRQSLPPEAYILNVRQETAGEYRLTNQGAQGNNERRHVTSRLNYVTTSKRIYDKYYQRDGLEPLNLSPECKAHLECRTLLWIHRQELVSQDWDMGGGA